jgi:hypothetical protein
MPGCRGRSRSLVLVVLAVLSESPVSISGRCHRMRSADRIAQAPSRAVTAQKQGSRKGGPAGFLTGPDQDEVDHEDDGSSGQWLS